jgi:GTPase SAR1 family protein
MLVFHLNHLNIGNISKRKKFMDTEEYKILVLGHKNSGKRALIERFCDDTYAKNPYGKGMPSPPKTKKIGSGVGFYYFIIGKYTYTEISANRPLFSQMLAANNIILITVDLSDPLNEAKGKLKEIHEGLELIKRPKKQVIVVAGTKCDQAIKSTETAIENIANEKKMVFVTTSAKYNIDVKKLFKCAAKDWHNPQKKVTGPVFLNLWPKQTNSGEINLNQEEPNETTPLLIKYK